MTETAIHRGIYNCPNCGAAAAPESVRCAYCHSTLATRVCPSCFGAIFIGMRHCPWCGARGSGSKTTPESVLKCPRCAVDMARVELGGRKARECEQCGGIWLDKDTLQEIYTHHEDQEAVMGAEITQIRREEAPKTERVYIPCPECGKLMNRNNFAGCSGVIIDWCKAHGSWFDSTELKQIVLFIRDGGLKKARTRAQARLEEEKAHLREEKLHLSRLSRLAGDSPQFASKEDADPLLHLLADIWRQLPD